jgi:MFS transporter, ACS family, tartrate transporter
VRGARLARAGNGVVRRVSADPFAALTIAAIGLYSFTPPFWSLPTAFLRGDAAAAGIALINAVGNLGGFLGPYVMGWMKDATGDYLIGLRLLATAALMSAVFVCLKVRAVTPASEETPRYRSAPS